MLNIEVVIFDCDGVMFHSQDANKAYYNELLIKIGLPKMSKEQTAFVHSNSVNESLKYLIKDVEQLSLIEKYRADLDYSKFIRLMKIEPTLILTLMELSKNFKIAIATNRTYTIKNILQYYNLKHFFELVICSSDVEHPKPKPDMLNKIIKYFRIHPSKAVYIGDSKLDELASISARIPFIAYKNKNLNALAHIKNLNMIKNIIKNF